MFDGLFHFPIGFLNLVLRWKILSADRYARPRPERRLRALLGLGQPPPPGPRSRRRGRGLPQGHKETIEKMR